MRGRLPNTRNEKRFQNGVLVDKPAEWFDTGSFSIKDRTAEELEKMVYYCPNRRGMALYGSKLYNCWRSAGCMRLGILPEQKGEVLELTDSSMSKEEFRSQLAMLADFCRYSDPLRACERCNGSTVLNRPVAEQINRRMDPFEKDKYI